MFSLLNVGKEKIADKLISSVKKRVTSISNEVDVDFDSFCNALEKFFWKKV